MLLLLSAGSSYRWGAAARLAAPATPEQGVCWLPWCRAPASPAGHPHVELGGERPAQVSGCLCRFQLALALPSPFHVHLSFSSVCPAPFRSQHQKRRQQPDLNSWTSTHNCVSRIPITSPSPDSPVFLIEPCLIECVSSIESLVLPVELRIGLWLSLQLSCLPVWNRVTPSEPAPCLCPWPQLALTSIRWLRPQQPLHQAQKNLTPKK